jgi:hypothetical protein
MQVANVFSARCFGTAVTTKRKAFEPGRVATRSGVAPTIEGERAFRDLHCRRLEDMSEAEIAELVRRYGPLSAAAAERLAKRGQE